LSTELPAGVTGAADPANTADQSLRATRQALAASASLVEHLRSQIGTLRNDLMAMSAARSALQQHNSTLQRAFDDERNYSTAMTASVSFRITAPLRAAARVASAARSRIRRLAVMAVASIAPWLAATLGSLAPSLLARARRSHWVRRVYSRVIRPAPQPAARAPAGLVAPLRDRRPADESAGSIDPIVAGGADGGVRAGLHAAVGEWRLGRRVDA
jgi:hypothetical protein